MSGLLASELLNSSWSTVMSRDANSITGILKNRSATCWAKRCVTRKVFAARKARFRVPEAPGPDESNNWDALAISDKRQGQSGKPMQRQRN